MNELIPPFIELSPSKLMWIGFGLSLIFTLPVILISAFFYELLGSYKYFFAFGISMILSLPVYFAVSYCLLYFFNLEFYIKFLLSETSLTCFKIFGAPWTDDFVNFCAMGNFLRVYFLDYFIYLDRDLVLFKDSVSLLFNVYKFWFLVTLVLLAARYLFSKRQAILNAVVKFNNHINK